MQPPRKLPRVHEPLPPKMEWQMPLGRKLSNRLYLQVFCCLLRFVFERTTAPAELAADEVDDLFQLSLALTGTCKAARFMPALYRLARLAPRTNMASFTPAYLMVDRFESHLNQYCRRRSIPYTSDWIRRRSWTLSRKLQIRGHWFHNVTICASSWLAYAECGDVLCFTTDSFAEMCLYLYSCVRAIRDGESYPRFICVEGQWHTGETENVIIMDRDHLEQFVKIKLLSSLRAIGALFPHGEAVTRGILNHSEYSWFVATTATAGKRDKKKPLERLQKYLHQWYSNSLAAPDRVNYIPITFNEDIENQNTLF